MWLWHTSISPGILWLSATYHLPRNVQLIRNWLILFFHQPKRCAEPFYESYKFPDVTVMPQCITHDSLAVRDVPPAAECAIDTKTADTALPRTQTVRQTILRVLYIPWCDCDIVTQASRTMSQISWRSFNKSYPQLHVDGTQLIWTWIHSWNARDSSILRRR